MARYLTDPATETEIQALAAEADLPTVDQAAELARLLRLHQPAQPRAAWPAPAPPRGQRSLLHPNVPRNSHRGGDLCRPRRDAERGSMGLTITTMR